MTAHHDHDDHDRGLAFDLETITKQVIARRRAIAWMGGAGVTALLAGCGGSDSGGTASTTATTSSSSSSTSSSASSSSSSSSSSTTASGCIADPSETSGPYPADGTNTASGSTSDILTQSGIVRSDIRTSFISSTDSSAGVLVTITLTLVKVSDSCAPLEGYAIYLWHADNYGHYSLYTAPTESYLRGVQVTDANGQVTFTTFYPPAYDGRWPHYHFEVFTSLAVATSGKNAALTAQLCMPEALSNTIFADTSLYPTAASIFKGLSLSTDSVFSASTAAQIVQQTPTFTGSVSAGYTATALIGV